MTTSAEARIAEIEARANDVYHAKVQDRVHEIALLTAADIPWLIAQLRAIDKEVNEHKSEREKAEGAMHVAIKKLANNRANARIATLEAALKKIAGLRYVEDANGPFDDALDIADAALSAKPAPAAPKVEQEPDLAIDYRGLWEREKRMRFTLEEHNKLLGAENTRLMEENRRLDGKLGELRTAMRRAEDTLERAALTLSGARRS